MLYLCESNAYGKIIAFFHSLSVKYIYDNYFTTKLIQMKTNDQIKTGTATKYFRWVLMLFLAASFSYNPAFSQGRHGEGRGNVRDRGSNVGSDRSVRADGGNRGRDMAMSRGNANQQSRRDNPVRIERNNRTTSPSMERNAQVRNNQERPRMESNRNPVNNRRPGSYNRPGGFNNRPVYGSANRPAYRPVYGADRRPRYSAYNPSWGYGFLPRRNSYFYSLPTSYLSISFGGIGYRYWDGVFYRPYNNLFTVIAPPVGIYINVLPVGYRRIHVRDRYYYYYNGTYYDQRDNNYYVVSPPLGAVVESLPAGYETVVIDGETFYTADGAQYKPVIQENGEIWYEVIKAN